MTAPSAVPTSAERSVLLRFARLPERVLDRWLIALVAALAGLVFLHTIDGEWVYDDGMQIVDNPYIKDPSMTGKALMSDVWAFMNTEGLSESRYWRPTFVGWMIVHQRQFGVLNPLPWRVSTILTHMLASVLAFLVARRLGLTSLCAGAVGVVFAVHPSRAESVAWVAGVTDPMLAVFVCVTLLAFMRVLRAMQGGGGLVGSFARAPVWWAIALAAYALALGTKEVAMLFPAVLLAIALWPVKDGDRVTDNVRGLVEPAQPSLGALLRTRLVPALVTILPFVLMAVAFAVARQQILGPDRQEGDRRMMGFEVNIFSLPRVGLFYVVQALFPVRISPFYQINHIVKPTLENFFLPGVAFLAVGAAFLWMAVGPARSRATFAGLTLFAALLAPAAYVIHFPPDTVVHDRYLYTPLLGLLVLVISVLRWALLRRGPAAPGADKSPDRALRVDAGIFAAGLLVMSLLGYQTLRYAEAWKSNYTMWEWAARFCPTSQYCLHHYGLEVSTRGMGNQAKGFKLQDEAEALIAAGRTSEAREKQQEAETLLSASRQDLGKAQEILRRAISIEPTGNSYLALADAYMADGVTDKSKYNQAEEILLDILGRYERAQAYPKEYLYGLDVLARVYLERDDDLDRAVAMYRRSIPLVKGRQAFLRDRMAMITLRWAMDHHKPERFDDALKILEEARPLVTGDPTAQSRMVLYRLGDLYAAKGRKDEARVAFTEFLRLSEGFQDYQLVSHGQIAKEWLRQNP